MGCGPVSPVDKAEHLAEPPEPWSQQQLPLPWLAEAEAPQLLLPCLQP